MMDKMQKKQIWLSVTEALGCVFIIDMLAAIFKTAFSAAAAIISFAVLLCVILLIRKKHEKSWKTAFTVLLLFFLLAALVSGAIWLIFRQHAGYEDDDRGDKESLFADKNIMLIVPHEDDDLNLLGGVMEEYIEYGSSVRVVFVTNGDFFGLGEERIRESLSVLESFEIPEENIIFLGYGDQMESVGGSFYNAPDPNELLVTPGGSTQTYGVPEHEAYREGNTYTKGNVSQDLKDVILEYRPDTIYCVDYDSHLDHQATSLLFEEVLVQILREEEYYHPLVLKGFAYSTAYYGVQDFYDSYNLKSTVKASDTAFMDESNVYLWKDRVRIPVAASSLSRSIADCSLFRAEKGYRTQDAIQFITGIINGDKVFWVRDTSSLCTNAEITVSSGYGKKLNDFHLADDYYNLDLDLPVDGVWIPDTDDQLRQATVTFSEPKDIAVLRLYDSPSLQDNVVEAKISFDNGDEITTGALAVNGSAAEITVNEKNIRSFTVTLLQTEGEKAGLTEIEAFSEVPETGLSFIKLMDAEENFVYDVWMEEETETFSLYTMGYAPQTFSPENYDVSVDNPSCTATIENGTLCVSCPNGEEATIKVQSSDGEYADAIRVSHPGRIVKLGFRIEKTVYAFLHEGYKQTAIYHIVHEPYAKLRQYL